MFAMLTLAVELIVLVVRLVAASACAPLSFQREIMRSPSSGSSRSVRYVNNSSKVNGDNDNTFDSGIGVRPALFSEGTEL